MVKTYGCFMAYAIGYHTKARGLGAARFRMSLLFIRRSCPRVQPPARARSCPA